MKKMFMFASLILSLLTINAKAASIDDVYQFENEGNMAKAVELAKNLAAKGDPESQYYMLGIVIEGKEIPFNLKTATKYAEQCIANKRSPEKNKAGCLRVLSVLVMKKEGGDADAKSKLAFKYVWQSARLGDEISVQNIHSMLCKDGAYSCISKIDAMMARCPDGPCARDSSVVINELNSNWVKAHQGDSRAKDKLTSLVCKSSDTSCPEKLARLVVECPDVKACANSLSSLTAN